MKRVVLATRLPLQRAQEILQYRLSGIATVLCSAEPESLSEVTAVIAEPDITLRAEQLQHIDGLRHIVIPSAGTDNVDLQAAHSLGIDVCEVRELVRRDASDHTLALILAVVRDVRTGQFAAAHGQWDVTLTHPRQVQGTRLGLVGFGTVAEAVARGAIALGMEVRAHNRRGLSVDAAARGVRLAPDLRSLLAWADVISVHVPLTPATKGLIGMRELSAMRPGSAIVNIARGAIIDSRALRQALDSGHLRTAALDVMDPEPPPADHPLLHHAQVLVTPHMAWYSPISVLATYERVGDELRNILTRGADERLHG
ncbi:NAD(P)-dependent oxidoreductase [Pseudoclavibacter sp. CFCC 11306]|uniref:NAD(P)-dependent oxidoreductase n=1 Tax=Pseudoclavibacter sp. CFCC 11306 TaxID=1564493 RepID=UPI00130127A6|nr:NAD(P)-dependent oxidoreductase [Pseudoclavibacter sp. CFCC 11306]KAB1659180.1 hypothetical protein F8O09_06435 [Pseudoclavibacter sp. CFCC 11306]